METQAQTFIDIFRYAYDKEHPEKTLKGIVIPMIQRDYAQGREDEHTKSVRKNFLDALHGAVTGTPITLDFIYGDITDGILTPLDGQQRLTTLFLLHWYAAKRAGVAPEAYDFLKKFSYETRSSARRFCEELVAFTPDDGAVQLSDVIIDQPWFPLSWKKDATVASMLVMLDAIQARFTDVQGLWERLQQGAITFYFLAIKDMGLTDELYIKMNSRGKPLTPFEHFKAEWDRRLRRIDREMARRILRKVDTDWTDLFWDYKGEDGLIDEAFLRYFHFACDILCYQAGGTPQGKPGGIFDLLARYFDPEDAAAKSHAEAIERVLDAWCGLALEGGPTAFVMRFLAAEHQADKAKLWDDKADLFRDCLASYGEMRDAHSRIFPLNKTVLFYAFHVYLLHRAVIAPEEFTERLRTVIHLILNSADEIRDSTNRDSDNRMQAILQQVDSIIMAGTIREDLAPNFNVFQLQEEQEKQAWLAAHPGEAEALHALEDHDLLYGQIGVVGLAEPALFPRFAELFACDWDAVDCALVATGDFRQRDRNGWRYQLGSSGANGGSGRRLSAAWQKLFHRTQFNKDAIQQTGAVLRRLLAVPGPLTDASLRDIAAQYVADCRAKQHYNWRYYYIQYPAFRRGRYGTYEWRNTDKPYECFAFWAELQASSGMRQPFLDAIDPENDKGKDEYHRVLRYGDYAVTCENDAFAIYECESIYDVDEDHRAPIERLPIVQGADGIDQEDRIVKGKAWLAAKGW